MSDTPAKKPPLKRILVLLILLALGGTHYVLNMRGVETTDSAQIEADIVPVSAKVAGYVKELKIGDNQPVKAGDLLLVIDPADYQIAFDKAAAELQAAEAEYEQSIKNLEVTKVSAPSSLKGAQAAVASAQAEYDRATKDAARNRQLTGIAASGRVIEQSNAAEKMARAQWEQAMAALHSAETSAQTIEGADAGTRMLLANIAEKKANLARAQKDLDYTNIVAPIDGKITKRAVQAGALIQPNQTLMAVTGAKLWVVANFKETQLEHMHAGMPVEIQVDAFPDMRLPGKIDSIQAGTGGRLSLFPPENATGNFVKVVQRVPVKIELDRQPDAPLALVPGMSVIVTVRLNEPDSP
jgi:membrane fusion protein (multidrug efflux system)